MDSDKENINEKKEVITFGGEEVKNVPFTQIFKYANVKEKLMIFIGIISSVIQGCVLPVVIYCLSNMMDFFISFVVNHSMKKTTGIFDDNILKELIDIFVSGNLANLVNLQDKYPDIDFNKYTDNSKYNFNFSKSFHFKTEEEISYGLNRCFITIGIMSIVAFVASFIFYSLLDISASRQCKKIRSMVFKSIMKQEISWHEKTNSGELSSRIIGDTLLIEDGIGSKIGLLFQNITNFIICILIAFITDWKLSLYLFGAFIIITSAVSFMSVLVADITKKNQDAYSKAGGIAQEVFSQIRTVVSFGNEQKESDRYSQNLIPSLKLGIKKSHISGMLMGLVFCISFCCYSVAFVKGGRFVYQGDLKSNEVFKVLFGIVFGSLALGACGSSGAAIGSASGVAAILFHIIEREPKINSNIDRDNIDNNTTLTGKIEFQNVHFTYPSRPDTEILKGISFKCLPGQTIALVGASGSGKSTIVQLLERFYEKSEGNIFIDDKKIEDFNINWLRSQIGLVSQEPILFDTTVAENIAISCPEATQEQIEQAAKLSNAHEFITELCDGYQTRTGEKGLKLSGGQKQRICIARALIKNPKILLLDEATSALDNQSEKLVQEALDSVSEGRTTVVIAHRLTTIKNADCIIVMDKGTIVESGTHDELMAQKSFYYKLVKNQELTINENDKIKEEEIVSSNDNTLVSNMDENEDEIDVEIEDEQIKGELNYNIVSSETESLIKHSENNISTENKSRSNNLSRYLDFNKPVMFKNCIGIIGSLLDGCFLPLSAYIYSSAVNSFTKQRDDLLDSTRYWGLMFIALSIANFFSAYIKNYGLTAAGEYLLYVFRKDMFDSMVKQEVSFFDSYSDTDTETMVESGANTKDKSDSNVKDKSNNKTKVKSNTNTSVLLSKLNTETNLVQGLNNNFGTIVELFTGLIVSYVIAFWFGWKLALILTIFTPFLFIGIYIQASNMVDKSEEKRRIFENSTKVAVEAITGIKTVLALNLEERFCKLYDEQLVEPEKRLEHQHIMTSAGLALGNCLTNVAYIVGFYFGFIFLKNGELDFESMTRVVMAIIYTSGNVGQASISCPEFIKSVDAFHRILEIIDRKPKINASDPKGLKKESLKGDLSFNYLRFHYPSRPDVTVLKLDKEKIEIPEGKTLALVGGSGCGKSTIIGLLLRWYDAQQGEILVDGKKNTDYNVQWLREQMSIVGQEPCLFNISIKENIRYGKEDATDEEVQEAAKKANIHEFIESLSDGYDTVVGGEGTSQLSGGQKQRIAIARAIIRNPKILLLDEATSALDAESELVVQKALEEVSQNRTIITIAHRLSTVKNANIIMVMKEGRIIEKGNHEELMAKKGEYYEMVLAGENGF